MITKTTAHEARFSSSVSRAWNTNLLLSHGIAGLFQNKAIQFIEKSEGARDTQFTNKMLRIVLRNAMRRNSNVFPSECRRYLATTCTYVILIYSRNVESIRFIRIRSTSHLLAPRWEIGVKAASNRRHLNKIEHEATFRYDQVCTQVFLLLNFPAGKQREISAQKSRRYSLVYHFRNESQIRVLPYWNNFKHQKKVKKELHVLSSFSDIHTKVLTERASRDAKFLLFNEPFWINISLALFLRNTNFFMFLFFLFLHAPGYR